MRLRVGSGWWVGGLNGRLWGRNGRPISGSLRRWIRNGSRWQRGKKGVGRTCVGVDCSVGEPTAVTITLQVGREPEHP